MYLEIQQGCTGIVSVTSREALVSVVMFIVVVLQLTRVDSLWGKSTRGQIAPQLIPN